LAVETASVKMLLAIIQPTKLEPLREALDRIGVTRMTVCDSQGYARQRGRTAMYRGREYKTNLLRKIALEIIVNDDFLDRTVDTLVEVARTGPEGAIGDGKIFVLPLDEAIDVSNGIRGQQAVN
jgi:nitrogen regulatory protein P-II 1